MSCVFEGAASAMQGSYSYKATNERRFAYSPLGQQRLFFKIAPVNANIAAIQFFVDVSFVTQQPAPAQVTLRDSAGLVQPFRGEFLIIWLESYVLSFNGADFLTITNQKQSSIVACGTQGLLETL